MIYLQKKSSKDKLCDKGVKLSIKLINEMNQFVYIGQFNSWNQNRAVSIAITLWVGQPGIRFPAGVADIRSKTHRPVLVLTQPHVQWASGFFLRWLKRPRREVDDSIPSNTKIKNEWS